MKNKNINYEQLGAITVKSQEELDDIPETFKGRIYIEFGTVLNKAFINKRYYRSVEVWGNSRVVAKGNSRVLAMGNSIVEAWENSSVVAGETSSVEAWENSSVVAMGNSRVVALENSSVEAWENSSVDVWGNSSSVVGTGNSQIVARLQCGKIRISGNSRIVNMPKNIQEFMRFYDIKHTKTKATFYKAVNKVNGEYISNWDFRFKYEIGKTKTEECDTNIKNVCSNGIHIAPLNWALDFGRNFENLAILEVETQIKDIVMPIYTDGKVRTSRIKVIREVPLEECGVFGKILAREKIND